MNIPRQKLIGALVYNLAILILGLVLTGSYYSLQPANSNDLQKMVDTCNKPCIIHLEDKDYQVFSTIQLPDDVTLIGKKHTTFKLASLKNTAVFQNRNKKGNQNIKLSNIKIEGTQSEKMLANNDGINISNGKNIVLENIIVKNINGSGFDILASDVEIFNVGVENAKEHGIVVREKSNSVSIDKANISFSENHGISFENTKNVQVHDSKLSYNRKNGISGIIVQHGIFTENELVTNYWSGLDIENLEYGSIERNKSYGNILNGIVVEQLPLNKTWKPSKFVAIRQNQVYENGWSGITIQESHDIVVENNEGWNNSVAQSNIGAMVHIKYDTKHEYSIDRRSERITIKGNTYTDLREQSKSTYGIAMNGEYGKSAGGNNVIAQGNVIKNTVVKEVRLLIDKHTKNIVL
jgi:hypothetical protein